MEIQGARFGPRAIRAASSRQTSFRGFNTRAGFNPYTSWARILDCGDIPVTPFDNAMALTQMTAGYTELLSRTPSSMSYPAPYFQHPKLITLGGDHSLALPALRALTVLYGEPIAVLHFDSHLGKLHQPIPKELLIQTLGCILTLWQIHGVRKRIQIMTFKSNI